MSQLGSENNYNVFDRLPDEILHSVFSRLNDAKSLCASMAVCRRFCSIVPQVDDIFLRVPRRKPVIRAHENGQYWTRIFSKNLLLKSLIIKPLRFISGLMIKLKAKKEDQYCDCDGCSYHTPNEILKPFGEIRSLHVKIPSYGDENMGSGKNPDVCTNLLKWKAEFGSQIQSCVILGAKSCSEISEKLVGENFCEPDLISDEELKLRIVWTISCLIAASARHELIREIAKERENMENVVISDVSDQGKVKMNRGQIQEMRNSWKKGGDDQVHSLRMKMWYVEKLEVPSMGKVMEGATVVAVRPSAGGGDGGMEELVAAAFGGDVVGEAVGRLMAASRCYTLEISSF
ncbi:F-box protein AUF2-like [Henckelia pumila]|uniref:F-box protein AUF2-like n=1 Tax=Henckelia pumila TaxID=405737 RepID=UPI003C6E438F